MRIGNIHLAPTAINSTIEDLDGGKLTDKVAITKIEATCSAESGVTTATLHLAVVDVSIDPDVTVWAIKVGELFVPIRAVETDDGRRLEFMRDGSIITIKKT